MKIIMNADYDYVGLQFCCVNMGAAIIRHEIFALPHSKDYPTFCVKLKSADKKSDFWGLHIYHCPFCGSKITYEDA